MQIIFRNISTDFLTSLLPYSAKFWWGKFCWFPARLSFNLSIFKDHYSIYRCMVKDSDHPSKYFQSNIRKVSIHQKFPPSKFCALRYLQLFKWLFTILSILYRLEYPLKPYMCNKRIVSGKKFIAIASVVFPVGVTNNENKN